MMRMRYKSQNDTKWFRMFSSFRLDSAPKCYGSLGKGFVTSMSKDDQQISSLAAQLDQRGCDDKAGHHFDEEQ